MLNSKGGIEFGRIDENVQKQTGLTPAPILLSEGIITNSKTNEGYGLIHIEARHGEQIRANGYTSALEFIEDVAANWQIIKEAKDRRGNPTYRLIAQGKHNNTLMIELSGDGTYWNINTAGIFKTSYGKNARELYNRHTTDKQSAETDGASQESEQSGTTDSSRMSAPATPERKVTNSASEKQEKGAESSQGALSASPQQSPDKSGSAFGSRDNSVQHADKKGELSVQSAVEAASAQVNTSPTPAQANLAAATVPIILRLSLLMSCGILRLCRRCYDAKIKTQPENSG